MNPIFISLAMFLIGPMIYLTNPTSENLSFAEQYEATFGEKPSEAIWLAGGPAGGKCGCCDYCGRCGGCGER